MSELPQQSKKDREIHPVWSAVNDTITRSIPPLLVAMTLGITSAAWSMYSSIAKLTDATARHEREISELRSKISAVEDAGIKRAELLEMLKRIEQQLEIALLRSGVKVPPKMISGGQ